MELTASEPGKEDEAGSRRRGVVDGDGTHGGMNGAARQRLVVS